MTEGQAKQLIRERVETAKTALGNDTDAIVEVFANLFFGMGDVVQGLVDRVTELEAELDHVATERGN